MKNLKLASFLILSIFTMTFISCDNEPLDGDFSGAFENENGNNQSNNVNVSSLLDKWWYDTEDFTADVYFHSDGLYEQKLILLGNEVTGTGDWFWENESEGIMKIENIEGTGQVLSEVWFRFSGVESNSIYLEQSQDGISYTSPRLYSDTD